jgi:FkbM family methyltransferase
MPDFLKRVFFGLYIILLRIKWLPVKKLNYKYGEMVISRLGRAKYKFDGLIMYLNPLNMIDKQMIMGKSQDQFIENLIASISWNNSIFIDIGANWGLFSLIAARKGAEVIAFEPVTRELQLLYRHIEINRLSDHIRVFPIGLSDTMSEMDIYLGPDRNTGTNSFQDNNSGLMEKCILNRLDNILPQTLAERIKLVKLDVEGFEMHVLNGMRKLMPLMVETKFVVEITPDFLRRVNAVPEDIYEFFSEYGYTEAIGIRNASQYDEVFTKAN